ncbi:MAG: LacI family transcriptional regulator [candidate division KSB1 bacterium]|nr:LacI family transcriptional regulator [candidate division KSB1 bacterium]MDZ7346034.1 LacI family transcriptional regulator [candidate division KSB1 bacterium]
MHHTTLKDIAAKLGVSTSTVSRALQGHSDIHPETRELVLKTAREMNYQPNAFAQNLKKKRSNTIGVIVPQVKHFFFAEIMAGITDVAYRAGYNVFISQSNEDYQREVINLQAMVAQRVAGLLTSLSISTTTCSHLEALVQRGVPLVCFDRVCEGFKGVSVIVDDYDGAFQATQHLISRGYRRIAHLAGPQNLSIGHQRLAGYRDALAKSGRPYDPSLVVFGGLNEEDGDTGFKQLLKQSPQFPDAIFCVTDPVALGAFQNIKQMGLHIPKDIALVGFSDNPIGALIDPPLTTVRQPAYEIGETAAKTLLDLIEHPESIEKNQTIILKTTLIVRQSS